MSIKLLNNVKELEKRVISLFIAFQILVFFPALENPSPWSDDWGYILNNGTNGMSISHDAIASGRPILGFIVELAYKSLYITRNLIIVQALAIAGLLLLQIAIFRKLRRNGFAGSISILTPLLLVLIPGIQGYVYFLSCFPYTWACLLGFLSYDFVNNGGRKRLITGCLILTSSLLIYPAGAMFYLLSLFIDQILRFKEETPFRNNVEHLITALVKFIACLVFGVLTAKAFSFYFGVKQASRVELVNGLDNLIEKISWIMSRIFVSEFRIFTVASPSPGRAIIELVVILFLLVFFILMPQKGVKLSRSLNFLMIILMPLLGALPNFLIRENQFEFRTLTATYAMSLVLWVYCFDRILQRVFESNRLKKIHTITRRNVLVDLVCALFVLITAFQVQNDSKDLWVTPSKVRDAITSRALQNLEFNLENSICALIPDDVYTPLKKLGVHSMRSDLVSPWVPEPYIRFQLERMGINFSKKILVHRTKANCNVSDTFIDYSPLGNGRT